MENLREKRVGTLQLGEFGTIAAPIFMRVYLGL